MVREWDRQGIFEMFCMESDMRVGVWGRVGPLAWDFLVSRKRCPVATVSSRDN